MFRGYDTNALWRHDEILRIRHMEAENADKQKEIDRQKLKAVDAILTSGLLEVVASFGMGVSLVSYPLSYPLPEDLGG